MGAQQPIVICGVWLGGLSILPALATFAYAGVPTVERITPIANPVTRLPQGQLLIEPVWRQDAAPVPSLPLRGLRIDGDAQAFVPHDVLGLVGHPITPELIAKIETLISLDLSTDAWPVIARYEPTPDAASGVLTFGVRRFTVAKVTAKGAPPRDARFVETRLGVSPGAAVDPGALAFDLDSLNRYPFRQVSVKVSPAPGTSQADVAVDITEAKPWSAFWGYKYSGGPHESWRRAYAGGSIGDLLGQDSVLSLQVTESPNALVRSAHHPDLSDADLTYTQPVDDRGIIEAGYELTGMNFKFPSDTYWLVESDGTLGYRYLLTGPAAAGGQSDVRAGIDLRHERVMDFESRGLVFNMTAEMNELYLGYHFNQARTSQQTDFDISLRLSPAVDMPGNTPSHFALYTSGRMKSARYGYVNFTLDETVGDASGTRWHTQLIGGGASGPLPYYDQAILGGQGNVRGYFLPDGSFDDALIWRNELKWTPKSGWLKNLSPYWLADIGVGHDDQLKVTKTLASAGFGVAVPVAKTVSWNLDLVHALRHAAVTQAGNTVVETNLKVSY